MDLAKYSDDLKFWVFTSELLVWYGLRKDRVCSIDKCSVNSCILNSHPVKTVRESQRQRRLRDWSIQMESKLGLIFVFRRNRLVRVQVGDFAEEDAILPLERHVEPVKRWWRHVDGQLPYSCSSLSYNLGFNWAQYL